VSVRHIQKQFSSSELQYNGVLAWLSAWSEVQTYNTAQPLTVSCFTKIQIGFTFLVPAHLGSPGKRAVKRVCVCELQYNLQQ